jgi:predicted phosphodiesterase
VKLWAIADLHLRHPANRAAVSALEPRTEDWLIVAGDVGEGLDTLRWAWRELGTRFARLFWVPGNHDLWSANGDPLAGDSRYRAMVELCREHGVLTPEDPFVAWPGRATPEGGRYRIAPLFLLYDYTFRPDDVAPEAAVAWAMEHEVLCSDEMLLRPDPYPSRAAWCAARCTAAEARLAAELEPGDRLVLINHWPLRQEHARLPLVPRFMVWCGTRRTEDWHSRFPTEVVVYGHLHIPQTQERDGVRFEEVSFGYPRNWEGRRTLEQSLRLLLAE